MLLKLIRAIRTRPDDCCAIVWHNEKGSKRCFPFLIGFGWRDRKGFNPTLIGYVVQTGQRDKYLMPLGYRSFGFSWYLFGSRWDDEPSEPAPEFDTAAIIKKLTPAQRSAVAGLDREFCVLGCSEPYAIRLAEANSRRPALAQMRQGEEFKEFALTDAGAAVKAAMEAGA